MPVDIEKVKSTDFKVKFNNSAALNAGLRIVRLIQDRTADGLDKDGNSFIDYSTKDFAMPAAAATKRARKILVDNDSLRYFRRDGYDFSWIVVIGGYVAYKAAVYKQSGGSGDKVNLSLTGEMMRSMTVLETSDNRIVIGFDDAAMAQRMFYNIEKGRDPMGLSDVDLQDEELVELLGEGLEITV